MSQDPVTTQPLKWLYVDFNSYFASVEQQLEPRLRGRPVIVVPVQSDATCAIAASYEAKAYGIKTNTPVYEARRLCPDLVTVVGQHVKYIAFHQRILEEINQHIPVTKACSIDEMACRLLRNEGSVTAATDIARRIKKGLRDNIGECLTCSIGIAPNKYLAKVATDMQKPNGLTILLPEELPERLTCLKLRDLPGVGSRMETRLNAAGIYTMQDLLRLSGKHLRKIWGNVWGEKIWLNLHGVDVPDDESGDRKSIGHSHVLAPELRPPAQAYSVATRLTLKCAGRLRRYGLLCSGVSLSLRVEHGARRSCGIKINRTDDSFIFLKHLHDLWSHITHDLPRAARFKKLSIVFFDLEAPANVQPDLFSGADLFSQSITPTRPKNHKLLTSIDSLNQKYGRDTVTLGNVSLKRSHDLGTKVAFTRIPEMPEFSE